MPPINLLIKPASGLCNLRCSYCFYHDITAKREQKSYGFMSDETLENVVKKALDFADDACTIAFQGGEPTLVGLDFYKRYIEFVALHNHKNLKINHAIQTNGFGLTAEWAEFFVANNFLVGLSLDGTKPTHDAFRHDNNGGDTFNATMQTISLFNRTGVQYNILTVVNSRTAKRIDSIYSFYKKQKFTYLQFIPCLNPLGEEGEKFEYTLTPKAYGEFLKTLFDLWYRDFSSGQAIHIRHFENYVEMLLGYPPESCGMSGVCGIQNVVEADGQVYPCDFYVLDRFKLGSLNECDFPLIDERRTELAFVEVSMQQDEKCKTCKHFHLCRGGCKRYREPETATGYNLNSFCSAYYDFFEYATTRLQKLAQEISRRMKC